MIERELDYIHFLDGPGVPGARETGVVNHASVADIEAVMRVSIAWGGQMRADRRFNPRLAVRRSAPSPIAEAAGLWIPARPSGRTLSSHGWLAKAA